MLTRFWSKVTEINGCWAWTAGKHGTKIMPAGYGRFQTGRRVMQAHRVAYELIHAAEIPAGLVVDHLCRNTLCVNPEHMEIVTQSINASRQIKVPLTHCRRAGHAYTNANTYTYPSGVRACRQCIKDRR